MKKLIVVLMILVSISAFAVDHKQIAKNFQIDSTNTVQTIIDKLSPETSSLEISENTKNNQVCIILKSKYGAFLTIIIEDDSRLIVKMRFNNKLSIFKNEEAKKVLLILTSGDDDEL